MPTAINQLKELVLDTLFPIYCIGCGKDNYYLCNDCIEKIPIRSIQLCPVCEKVTMPHGEVCYKCKNKTQLTSLLIATRYKNELVKQAVHLLKYRFISDFSVPLGKLIIKAFIQHNQSLPDIILPIPLHSRRLRWRGFNQAELLAKYLSKNLAPGMEIPVRTNILIRKRYTPPQMEIKNFNQRRKNLSSAFVIAKGFKKKEIQGKNVLLIDDIATTGTTLFECANVLTTLNPHRIDATIVARQEFSTKNN